MESLKYAKELLAIRDRVSEIAKEIGCDITIAGFHDSIYASVVAYLDGFKKNEWHSARYAMTTIDNEKWIEYRFDEGGKVTAREEVELEEVDFGRVREDIEDVIRYQVD